MSIATGRVSPALTIGSRACCCPTCDEYFNSVAAFDKHRTGTYETVRRCLAPDEMTAAGMSVNQRGFWVSQAFNPDAFTA